MSLEGKELEGEQVWRVKLYQLGKEGNWQDQGTGDASCPIIEDKKTINVMNEDKSQVLLDVPIRTDENYERQGDSIIMWREPGADIDCALSFQDVSGCEALWQTILTIQDHQNKLSAQNQHAQSGLTQGDRGNDGNGNAWSVSGGWGGRGQGFNAMANNNSLYRFTSLKVTAESLTEIKEQLSSLQISQKREFAEIILRDNGEYIEKLLGLFIELETSNNRLALQCMAEIFRSIALLNNESVLDILVDDNMFLRVAAVMEYDSVLQEQGKFRTFLGSNAAKISTVAGVDMSDPAQLGAISKLFRLKFLRDSLIRPGLEEFGATMIENIVLVTANDVCALVFQDNQLLARVLCAIRPELEPELLYALEGPTISEEEDGEDDLDQASAVASVANSRPRGSETGASDREDDNDNDDMMDDLEDLGSNNGKLSISSEEYASSFKTFDGDSWRKGKLDCKGVSESEKGCADEAEEEDDEIPPRNSNSNSTTSPLSSTSPDKSPDPEKDKDKEVSEKEKDSPPPKVSVSVSASSAVNAAGGSRKREREKEIDGPDLMEERGEIIIPRECRDSDASASSNGISDVGEDGEESVSSVDSSGFPTHEDESTSLVGAFDSDGAIDSEFDNSTVGSQTLTRVNSASSRTSSINGDGNGSPRLRSQSEMTDEPTAFSPQKAAKQGLRFLQELFALSRTLAHDRRVDLYERLSNSSGQGVEKALLTMCTAILAQPESESGTGLVCVAEILCAFSMVCPDKVRQFVLRGPTPAAPPAAMSQIGGKWDQPNPKRNALADAIGASKESEDPTEVWVVQKNSPHSESCLLWVLMRRLVLDSDPIVIELLGDTLKVVIDPERLHRGDKDKFLAHFYDHYIHWLLVPFSKTYILDPKFAFDSTVNNTATRQNHQRIRSPSPGMHEYPNVNVEGRPPTGLSLSSLANPIRSDSPSFEPPRSSWLQAPNKGKTATLASYVVIDED